MWTHRRCSLNYMQPWGAREVFSQLYADLWSQGKVWLNYMKTFTATGYVYSTSCRHAEWNQKKVYSTIWRHVETQKMFIQLHVDMLTHWRRLFNYLQKCRATGDVDSMNTQLESGHVEQQKMLTQQEMFTLLHVDVRTMRDVYSTICRHVNHRECLKG